LLAKNRTEIKFFQFNLNFELWTYLRLICNDNIFAKIIEINKLEGNKELIRNFLQPLFKNKLWSFYSILKNYNLKSLTIFWVKIQKKLDYLLYGWK